jgi:hypothetical protein
MILCRIELCSSAASLNNISLNYLVLALFLFHCVDHFNDLLVAPTVAGRQYVIIVLFSWNFGSQ